MDCGGMCCSFSLFGFGLLHVLVVVVVVLVVVAVVFVVVVVAAVVAAQYCPLPSQLTTRSLLLFAMCTTSTVHPIGASIFP